MKKYKLNEFKDGWIIGNFEPSILKTKGFEIAILNHYKNQKWPTHYHNEITEYNLLLDGKMIINKIEINKNDIFVLEPKEVAEPVFLEDCKILCIKVPSIIGDKIEIE